MPAAAWFPDHFLFGTATAAHQIEGGNVNSDWWAFEHAPGSICAEPSGDACDSWHRWEEDLDLVASMGLGAYRFSVEWARVEPEPGVFSVVALDHYRRVTEGCRHRGIVPVVTLHHFTLPRWMADRGGFESPDVAAHMAAYAARVGDALGDQIGLACTINEPSVVALNGYLRGAFPPGVRDRARFDVASANLRASHRGMVAALRAGRGSYPVGITLSMTEMEFVDGGEARYAQAIECLEDAYLRELAGDDFVGVQTYSRVRYGADGPLAPPEGVRRTKMGYEWRPEAVEHTVRRAAAVTGLPVVVTEMGISADDDAERIEFINGVARGIASCLGDGLDVRGLFYWSLLDNFEWTYGYAQRFGLVSCDRTTFERTAKPSAAHFGQLAASVRRTPGAPDGAR